MLDKYGSEIPEIVCHFCGKFNEDNELIETPKGDHVLICGNCKK